VASKRLLLFEEVTPETGRKVYAGGYSEIVLCTEGGDVEVCRAICEYLIRHRKRITVTGRCQSAGVLIAAAGQETQAYPGVEWLHHECSGEIEGRPHVVRAHAEFMRRADEWANRFLGERTGRPAARWREDALRETVFTNEEALEWGLLDREL
jgi:ATP-dependent protease ClpP protease subunit